MPATIKKLAGEKLEGKVEALAAQIRLRRKALGVSVTTAAQAAGISRVTWHRIEKGEISVTIGAWFNVLAVLGLEFGVGLVTEEPIPASSAGVVPVDVKLSEYPQLAALAWQVQGVDAVSAREAFDIYDRNERHLDEGALTPNEEALINNLRKLFGGHSDV